MFFQLINLIILDFLNIPLNLFLTHFPQFLSLLLHLLPCILHLLQSIFLLLPHLSCQFLNLLIFIDRLIIVRIVWIVLIFLLFFVICTHLTGVSEIWHLFVRWIWVYKLRCDWIIYLGQVVIFILIYLLYLCRKWSLKLVCWPYSTSLLWTLIGHSLSLITIGSARHLSDSLLIPKHFLPTYHNSYISESSRWCLLIRKGVLLEIVVFVWLTFNLYLSIINSLDLNKKNYILIIFSPLTRTNQICLPYKLPFLTYSLPKSSYETQANSINLELLYSYLNSQSSNLINYLLMITAI